MGKVIFRFNDTMWAIGDPSDMGIYTAWYMWSASALMDNAKKLKAEKDLAEKLAREFKGIRIVPMPQKEDGMDAAEADRDSEKRDM